MSYFFGRTLEVSFAEALESVTAGLKEEGFGILTEVDVGKTLKEKLDIDFNNYMILGACNPSLAYKALLAENKIGTMLPCNVIVQELEDGQVEVAAIDPVASMISIDNPELKVISKQVQEKLRRVIEKL
jgi:uncharacterized protein (DUF302 family)